LSIAMQRFPVSLLDRESKRSIANAAAVDKQELLVCARSRGFGQTDDAVQTQAIGCAELPVDNPMRGANFIA
jgi:hypothetical protein